jgi:hypothetical protein
MEKTVMDFEMIGILAAAAVIGLGAWTAAVWHKASTGAVASYQQKLDEADAKLAAQAKLQEDAAANHITGMTAAFNAGANSAKNLSIKVQTKGQQYVAANKAFDNPACNVGDDIVHLINYESANMRAASTAGFSDAGLPASAAVSGRPDENNGKPNASGSGPQRSVGTVPPKPRPIDRTGTVSR